MAIDYIYYGIDMQARIISWEKSLQAPVFGWLLLQLIFS